jgi:hypothetical protein
MYNNNYAKSIIYLTPEYSFHLGMAVKGDCDGK